ncbi:MAG: guanylate kinase [Lachnospiraceae bacterium]|nr:guanylate kinase [Lachnospiraceae bacterium]
MEREGILVVISGFAGAGKGTIVKGLMEKYEDYALSVSMTTRAPRPGETEGISYFFVDKEKFEQTIAEGGLIEYANYCGNYYGTPKAYVEAQLRAGKDVILEIEIQGAMQIKRMYPTALLLFITPPDADTLRRRLVGRGTETMEVINKRMARAVNEAEGIEEYDYIIVNDTIERAIADTRAVIGAAHARPFRNGRLIQGLREELRLMSIQHRND